MQKPKPDGSMEGPGGLKAFAKLLVSNYALGVDAVRFSVVSFASIATTRVGWSTNDVEIYAAIDQMDANGKKTSISAGLEAARQLFTASRPGATKIALLFSDGEQSSKYGGKQGAIDSAAVVKASGVDVFAWGMGNKVSLETMQKIATDSSKAIYVKKIGELSGYLADLEAAVCNESPRYFLAGGGESCSTACTNQDDSFPETLSIAGNPAYASQTRGQYTKAAGLEYAGAPVYKRNRWSLYKRSNGKWCLDFNELDDSWAGTVNYASAASDTPFAATWNRDMVVNKDSACDLGAITSAASSVARCVNVVSALGMSFTKSGMYPGDDSGCTYYFGQTGWVQVMNSGLDSGATPAPTCDEINRDQSRRRVCACSMKA